MIKRDNWLLGILIGVLVPLFVTGLLYLVFLVFGADEQQEFLLKPKYFSLFSVFFNMIVFRYYMVNLKYDKTGRGILIITMIYAVYFFSQIS